MMRYVHPSVTKKNSNEKFQCHVFDSMSNDGKMNLALNKQRISFT